MPETSDHKPWEWLRNQRVYDLAHPMRNAMPSSPNHPGFTMSLMRRHGDRLRADGGSAANELIVMGGHTGTHVDALCHVSHDGRLHGQVDADRAQRTPEFGGLGVDTIPLTVTRGVLLDIAGLHGVEVLEPGHAIDSDQLEAAAKRQGVSVESGDVLLIRSGWSRHWDDRELFLGLTHGAPGPDESAAHWLVERGVRMTGAETLAYEHIPPGRGHALLPVHRILLVEAGIHIIEVMKLCALAENRVWEFLFILTPLKIEGATGVPVRPVALSSKGC